MSFDERMRRRAVVEDYPLPEGFRQRLETKIEEITEEEKSVKRRIFRTFLLAAALCAALVGTALAASPTLREALAAAWGSFEPYSQTVEGVSAVDRGIEIKVVSALMDENDGTAYLEVRDLEGDRLGEDMRLKTNIAGRHGRWMEPLAYDGETKTALFEADLSMPINEVKMGKAEELEITFYSLHPGRVELAYEEVPYLWDGTEYTWERGIDIPKTLYTRETLRTRPLTEAEREREGTERHRAIPVLLPDQTPADLGSPYVSLSSLGFDENGVFHIQLALADGVYTTDYGLDVDLCPGYWYEDLGLEGGMEYRRTLLEGGRYYDIAFMGIGSDFIGNVLAEDAVPPATVTGTVYTAPPIEGEWKLSFPHEPLPKREVPMVSAPFCYGDVRLEKVQISAMSIQLTLEGNTASHYFGGLPAHVFCRDGSVLKLEGYGQCDLHRRGDGPVTDGYDLTYEQRTQGEDGWRYWGERESWAYPRAVAPEDVMGFSWGLWYVPLEGERLGQGYWLFQLPTATE